MLIVSLKTLCPFLIKQAEAKADALEFRIDCISPFSLWELCRARKNFTKPCIFTLRKKLYEEEATWYANMRSLAKLQPDYIDLEHSISKIYIDKLKEEFPKIQWIASYHGTLTLGEIEPMIEQLQNRGTFVKIISIPNSFFEALELMHFVQKIKKKNICCLGMGKFGGITRLLSPVIGNQMNYACIEETQKTAEGQLSIDSLLLLFSHSEHIISI